MDVLEVISSSDVVLPMLATAMADPPCSTPACPLQLDAPPQPRLPRQQAPCPRGPHAPSPIHTHTAAVEDEATQKSADAAAAAAAQPGGIGLDQEAWGQLHYDAGHAQHDGQSQQERGRPHNSEAQLQDEPGIALAGHAQDGPNNPHGYLQPAPGHSQNGFKNQLSHAASAKAGGPPQEELPIWLRPMAPQPGDPQLTPPRYNSSASTCQLRQRQEWRHNSGDHAMQAGLAQTTMRPPCVPQAPLQQGFGQIVAPVDQQQLPPDLLQYNGLGNGNIDSKCTTTNVVAPVDVLRDRVKSGTLEAAEQPQPDQGEAFQQGCARQGACQAKQAAAATPDPHQMHDQAEFRPLRLSASGTGQFRGVSALVRPRQAVPGDAKHDQTQHAQYDQQPCLAQGEESLCHQSSHDTHIDTV